MRKRILLYNSGGGLGDSIQLISLILSLQNHFKESEFYYLGSHENHYLAKLKEYNITIKNLDLNLKYFGFRWWHYFFVKNRLSKTNIQKFDTIIDLQSKMRNTLILKKIPFENFYSSTFNYYFCTQKNNYIKNNNLVESTFKNLNKFFNINIKKVEFDKERIEDKYHKEAKRLLPNNNYIGFSITQGNLYRKKSWPVEKFIDLAKKVKRRGKVPVFFIEKSNLELIDLINSEVEGAIFPERKSALTCPALVTVLAARLEKAISIDNGIMHMIDLANIPMILLFGPTSSEKFAPKKNNIIVLDSNIIYKSNDISKIGVEEVIRNI